jgi:flagellar protein FliJ
MPRLHPIATGVVAACLSGECRMNSRNTLHRTQQWQLAERQRYLTELEALGEKLRADVLRLRDEIDQAGGEAVPSNKRLDPLFIRPLLERRERLERSVVEIDAQIVEARQALASAQQEAKLVEGALVHRGLKFEDRLTRRARRST